MNKVLTVIGCGVALTTALVLGGRVKENKDLKTVRKHASGAYVSVKRDTIDVNNTAIKSPLQGGRLEPLSNTVIVHWFNDLTTTKTGHETVDRGNKKVRLVYYHEMQHARNHKLFMHYKKFIGPQILLLDEFSANTAQYLADFCDMPEIPNGVTSLDIDYTLDKSKYALENVADALLNIALLIGKEQKSIYLDYFDEATIEERLICKPFMDTDQLINEMLTFKINGKWRNLYSLANENTRQAVKQFLTHSRKPDEKWNHVEQQLILVNSAAEIENFINQPQQKQR